VKIIYVIKNRLNQLEAHDLESEKILESLKESTVYKITPKKDRNYKHHCKFRAMANKVFDNQDTYETEEDLITEIKLRCGWYKEHITVKGKMIYVPKSLSFEECDQVEFDEFYKKAVNCCLKYFIGADNQELIDEICRF
jgi:hypothetical protein